MLERIFEVDPAFDKRNSDPEKDRGIHGSTMRFIVKGNEGAVQFVIYTNWHLLHVQKELIESCQTSINKFCLLQPMPIDIGYHSPKPMYDEQICIKKSCKYIDEKPCYYSGSMLNSEKYFNIMVSEGSEKLWESLEEYYNHIFMEVQCNSITKEIPFISTAENV